MRVITLVSFILIVFSCKAQEKKPFFLHKYDDDIINFGKEGKYKKVFKDSIVFSLGYTSLGTTDKFIFTNKKKDQSVHSLEFLKKINFMEIEELYKLYEPKIDSAVNNLPSFNKCFISMDTLNLVEINNNKEAIIYSVIWETNVCQME